MLGTATDLIAYAGARGVNIEAAEAPTLLTKATDYLNGFSWIGEPYDLTQEDSWPRYSFTSPGGAFLSDDGSVTGIKRGEWVTDPVTPRPVMDALYLLAISVNDGVDLVTVADGAQVKQETVGPITMVYESSTIGAGVSFSWWDKLLDAYLDNSGYGPVNFDVFRG